MEIIERVQAMYGWAESQRQAGRRIVLVPTMGFLHEGHLCLVRDGKQRGDRLVVSVFVNPTQFGPQEDFGSYPRDFMRDRDLLENERVDVLFHPSVEEIYPDGFQASIRMERLGAVLCAAQRPAHFPGVATVVAKLFNIVRPHTAIFGEKDYKQLLIIRRLVRDLNFPVEVVGHPIVREADGLAMSSRNAYLSVQERQAAQAVPRALRKAELLVQKGTLEAAPIVAAAKAEIEHEPLVSLDYVKVCDLETLEELDRIRDAALLALAVRIGKARLIDNTVLKR
jgi:pantoate--beta-alanine ligase